MTRQTYFMLEVASNTVDKDNIERLGLGLGLGLGEGQPMGATQE